MSNWSEVKARLDENTKYMGQLAADIRAALEEIERLRLDLTEACRGGAVLARERNVAEAEVERLRHHPHEHENCPSCLFARGENARLRAALEVGVEAVVNLCTHLYLTPIEAHWHDGPRQDLKRMRAALAPEVK